MEQYLSNLMQGLPMLALIAIVAGSIGLLGKGADILVSEAVVLSAKWGVPKMLIGATVVSLGTTLPEASVSVAAALAGTPGLALGNAVGSIICDTGLILGIATLISPLKLNPKVVNRQGWIQLGSGVLLVMVSLPFAPVNSLFTDGGIIPQYIGWIFLLFLVLYIILSVRWAQRGSLPLDSSKAADEASGKRGWVVFVLLILGILMVVGSSEILIPAVREIALRMRIPDAVIGATLVAFGTSLPELVTAVTSARKGHGDLAVGNIIGADILNVLFVVGAAASVTAGGLSVQPDFYRLLYPAMLLVLVIFRIGIAASRDTMKRPFGALLLGLYLVLTVASYLHNAATG